MTRAAKREVAIDTDDVVVRRGDVFDARGGKVIVVDAVAWDTGVPRVSARVLPACEHATLRVLAGGECPVCKPDDRAFEIALTWAGDPRRWRMPAAYAPRRG